MVVRKIRESIEKKKSFALLCAAVAVVVVILALTNSKAHAAWVDRGPFPTSGDINAMLVDQNGILWASTTSGYICKWDGSQWSNMGQWPYSDVYLSDMTLALDGSIYAGGDNGSFAKYDGNQWIGLGNWGSSGGISCLAVAPGGSIWAGGYGNGYVTNTCRWDGTHWENMGSTSESSLASSVAAVSSNSIFVMFTNYFADPKVGFISHWNGSSWADVGNIPFSDYIPNNLIVTNDSNVWCSADDCIYKWDGINCWNNMGQWPHGGKSISVLALSPDGSIWAGGKSGYTARWNGTSWENRGQWVHGNNIIGSMVVTSEGIVWAGGNNGCIASISSLSPDAPILSVALSDNNALLSWTSIDGSTSYLLEKSTDCTNFSQVIETSNLTYTDLNLAPGTYCYRVRSKNSHGYSEYSNVVSVTIDPLQAPQLSVSLRERNALLSWTSIDGATSYLLEKSTDCTNFSQVIETSNLTYTDPNLTPGTYCYRVRAKNSHETSPYSNVVSVTINYIPSDFRAYWNGNYITVEWNGNDKQVVGNNYELWRLDKSVNKWFSVWKIDNIETFVWNDNWVVPNINYKYAVRQMGGLSNWYEWETLAESDWATGDRPLAAPGGLRIVSSTESSAVVQWSPISGTSTYTVLTSTDDGNSWQSTSTGGTSATVTVPSIVRVKAGTHARSQWSGILRVN
ncbi:MAG: fibronectin type III domain-containing protein [Candidatus Cloacimonetes bacterium]|nr:fibronectin type III domain-containing protein [Candidatus Cloacimonadota bacterium]